MFSSDNGPHREGAADPDFNDSNGPLRGYKGDLWEGGIRVPFIARWPGHVPAAKTSDSPVYFADLLPTLSELCGADSPTGIDGADISPTLLGSEQPQLSERFMYWEFNKQGLQQQAARWREWKAIRNPNSKSLRLYNLADDVAENSNLAADHADIAEKFDNYFQEARSDSPDWPVTLAGSGRRAAALRP
jgi:arylsulfatase A-like enzyme